MSYVRFTGARVDVVATVVDPDAVVEVGDDPSAEVEVVESPPPLHATVKTRIDARERGRIRQTLPAPRRHERDFARPGAVDDFQVRPRMRR